MLFASILKPDSRIQFIHPGLKDDVRRPRRLAVSSVITVFCMTFVAQVLFAHPLAANEAEPIELDIGPTLFLNEGVLNIIGTDANERMYAMRQGENFVVQYNIANDDGDLLLPWAPFIFPANDVIHIFGSLGGGDDTFINFSEVSCTIHGDDGSDLLHGGTSSDSLYGDAGGDTVFGGFGSDFVSGGAESDVICGGDFVYTPSEYLLFDPDTLSFRHDALTDDWVKASIAVDEAVDTLRGDDGNPAADADWFILEVVPDEMDNPWENDIALDLAPVDWTSFNSHFW